MNLVICSAIVHVHVRCIMHLFYISTSAVLPSYWFHEEEWIKKNIECFLSDSLCILNGVMMSNCMRDTLWNLLYIKHYFRQESTPAYSFSQPWMPGAYTSFKLLLSIRLCAAVWNIVGDCDETYNYWEPVRYYLLWKYRPLLGSCLTNMCDKKWQICIFIYLLWGRRLCLTSS
jgi:alpha-1,2-mannosyltransferase